MNREVLVVGSGMAGLTLATARAAAGDRVTVLDKGRRHGGRMATRRVDGVAYDTGVASFTVRSATTRAAADRWVTQGHAVELVDRAEDVPRRFRGHPTMRALPTALADSSAAEVRQATTVVGLEVVDGRWEVSVEDGRDGPTSVRRRADALVLTCPAPQALALLRTTSGLASVATLERLEGVTYDPCLAVLVRPVDPTDAARVAPHTMLADATFSAAHLDGDRTAAAHELAARAAERLGATLEVAHVHGWRYAQVARGIDLPALRDDTAGPPLVIAGDLCTAHEDVPDGDAEGVERAYLSALAGASLLDGEGP